MAEDIKQEMNSTPGCIPTKWTRTTVADGDWLQENTIKPLSSRDNFLADKLSAASVDLDALSAAIDTVSSISDTKDTFLSGSIDYVSATLDSFSAKVETSAKSLYDSISAERYERLIGDENLQGKINVLEAANDVIMVYGTHEEFVAGSASLHLTDKDVIKVLFDDTVSSNQVYYEYTLSTNSWDKIGELDPYYSKAEIESFSANLSSTIAKIYLSANGTDISAGKNLDVVIQSNNPRVAFKTKDDVSFESVSATTFSGNTIKGETKTSTIDGLITSAEEGNKAANGKTVIETYYNANDIEKDSFEISSYGDKFSFYVSAQPNSPTWMQFTTGDFNTPGYPHAVVLSADRNLCQNWLNFDSKMYKSDFENWSASQNSTFNGSARLAGSADLANSATIAANTQDKLTAYYKENNTNKTGTFNVSSLTLSAGKGINFVSGANQLSISSEGTTYTTGQYINISNDNKISVTNDLVNSAKSGWSAYNALSNSATMSAGFGITFTSVNSNTLGIKLNATLNEDDKIASIGGKELVGGTDLQFIGATTGPAPDYYPVTGAVTSVSAFSFDGAYGSDHSQGIQYKFKDSNNTNHTFYSIFVPSSVPTPGSYKYLNCYTNGDDVVYDWKTLEAGDYINITNNTISLESNISATNLSSQYLRLRNTAATTTYTCDLNGYGFNYGGDSLTWRDILDMKSTVDDLSNETFISGNGTITAIVSASTIGSQRGVLYLV